MTQIIGMSEKSDLMRVLAYGESGRKKSWWLGTAAEFGFNVLILNADKPARIFNQLSPAAQGRLRIVNVVGEYNYSELVARLLRGDTVFWDITAGVRISAPKQAPDHDLLELNLYKLDHKWVVGIDSWTALATATVHKVADDKSIDLSEVSKIEWDHYGASGIFLDWCLERLVKKLPSHVVVVGHPDIWEKRKIDQTTGKPDKSGQIDFIKTQPLSISRPHGKKLVKHFTDTLFFTMIGNQHYIDTTSTADRDGGSTTVAPKLYKWDELSFTHLCQAAHIAAPVGTINDEGCRYLPAGTHSQPITVEQIAATRAGETKPLLVAATATEQKPDPFAALRKAKG